ncbi:hypothetical protein SAY87_005274 [Trapa incisa]|uniref:Uncharacterized protein n=1 Tax=Trapa incisa TaxID=236973 RepID=A0AAN7Q629_9MYRT|nr:hypothetical protein SAY87_005274 [Trapa incisa]
MEDTIRTQPSNFLSELKFNPGSIQIPPIKHLLDGFDCDARLPNGFPNPKGGPFSHSSTSSEADSPEENDFWASDSSLKFISEILMEEDLEEKPCMLLDCLALQAAEKSFYDVLNQEYDPSSVCIQNSSDQVTQNAILSSPQESGPHTCSCQVNNFIGLGVTEVPPSGNHVAPCVHLAESFVSNYELDSYNHNEEDGENVLLDQPWLSGSTGVDSYEGNLGSSSDSRGKKSHGREEVDFPQEGRMNKQSAISKEEPEQLELFDEVLLCQAAWKGQMCPLYDDWEVEPSRKVAENSPTKGRSRQKKRRGAKGEVVDLWTLLTQCAQAVAANDHRSSTELIKHIRQHSSPYGDGNQRMAHCFVNGLEARLAGTEAPTYLSAARTSAADILKAYQFYARTCPFQRMSNVFTNRTIMRMVEKATTLHIIDFGILYGFQWPCLIQRISKRRGGPPKIRMTGIELPQPGFKPAERVEETGSRLAKYCERFGVEFEYYAIAKKWEMIQLEDLKIDRNDFTVVNCLYRLRYLLDESVVIDSPRDAVLKLIRSIEPDLFVHGVVNGTYNTPFFLTRFREALFHFSSLFDMFEVAQDERENEHRMMYEQQVFGRNAMNVIACEGAARVERPESYKQWQVRNMRAGFRQIQIYDDLFKKVKSVIRSEYHKDFIIDQDMHWMLQGWKGRIIMALSCWVPA